LTDRIVPLGEAHQGLGNALIDGNLQDAAATGSLARRERLGGLL